MIGSGLTGTGNSDADTLVTLGANTLVGGDDNDTFVFFAGSANGATVADFNRNQVSELDLLVFSGFGTGLPDALTRARNCVCGHLSMARTAARA